MADPSSIDYLFEDEDLPLPTTTTFPFEHLPAELQNAVYEAYFAAPQTIKINASGALLFPPLTHTSRQLRFETAGYVYAALARPGTRIHAQIRDYDVAPLLSRLAQLSRDLDIPQDSLVAKVSVSFVGAMHCANLLHWIRAHLAAPAQCPVFAYDCPSLPAYGAVSLFAGPLSLVEFVAAWYRPAENAVDRVKRRRAALRFLELTEELGCDYVERAREMDDEALAGPVFRTVAVWHHLLGKYRGELAGGKRGSGVRGELCEFAGVVYAFAGEFVGGRVFGRVPGGL
ncbi:hypothetical protein BU26DRAFT_507647 [Trematosphaeria pertusa]|uniref:Uncharacterized protein n=1 Tax=Trematosphaeria pertusa TaxID=390896 RepID=A0A6A6I6M8_9PLEO|nr:uncharacterized protein BU26DRAFT_507647 [Trematosphaeria pertusa]KAF2245986.1 hypothetical protein BU26DRAFT_507647 [Trematosphaeria pertusa]